MFDSIRETIDYSVENNISFADMMIKWKEKVNREEVRDLMRQNLNGVRQLKKVNDWRWCGKCNRLYRS